jgi:hypothetical protein
MNRQQRISYWLIFRSAIALAVLCAVPLLGGCQEQLFTGHDQNIGSKSQYFPDPHPIEQAHPNAGTGGGAMPFGGGQNGF